MRVIAAAVGDEDIYADFLLFRCWVWYRRQIKVALWPGSAAGLVME